MASTVVIALPSDLDTMPRRDLAAFAEAHGAEVSARDTADTLRTRLRDLQREQRSEARNENVRAVRTAHAEKNPPVKSGQSEQVIRDSLWGLANLFSRVQGEADTIAYTVEGAIPVLLAFLNGDERIDREAALAEVRNLQYGVESVRQARLDAEKYAVFVMGDAARRVEGLRATHERKPAK
jgi:hypothetical protein